MARSGDGRDAEWNDWALDEDSPVVRSSEVFEVPSSGTPLATSPSVATPKRPSRPPTFDDGERVVAVATGSRPQLAKSPAGGELSEDYTGEFDDVSDDLWDDAAYSYLDEVEEDEVDAQGGLTSFVTHQSADESVHGGVSGGPVLHPAKKGGRKRAKKLALRSVLAVLLIVSVLVSYGAWKLSRFERNEADETILDGVGLIRTGEVALPTTTPTVTLPGVTTPVVTPGPDTTTPIAPAPVSTLVPPSTIPGEGSCEDDPACAGAVEVVLPENEVPRPGGRLVDRVDVEPIGGPDAINTLIVGVDSRDDIPVGQEKSFGVVSGSRADTIIVMRTSPDGKQAALLSFNRDLYVYLPVQKRQDRINAAYGKGVNSLIKTIQENFNIPVNHAVEIDFAGFQEVVTTLGGIEICFDKKSRDLVSGLDEEAGCHVLDEKRATQYIRSRFLEVEIDGKWVADNRGDFGRVERQQNFIKQVLQKALDDGLSNPLKANGLMDTLQDAVTIDKKFGRGDILETLRIFSGFQPSELQRFTVSALPAKIKGKQVLRVNRPKASPIVAKFGTRTE